MSWLPSCLTSNRLGSFADQVGELGGAIGAGVEIRVARVMYWPIWPSENHSPSGSIVRIACEIRGIALAGGSLVPGGFGLRRVVLRGCAGLRLGRAPRLDPDVFD